MASQNLDPCTQSVIYALESSSRCLHITNLCSNDVNMVNITKFYFCTIDEYWTLMIPISIICIFFLFRLISEASDEFLSVSLNRMSKVLGLSEALTGVTLIALANGSPDMISSMVAGSQTGGELVSIGALYGANLFVCNFVFASVIFNAPKQSITLNGKYFVRDVGVCLLSTCFLITMGFFHFSRLMISVSLLMIYLG